MAKPPLTRATLLLGQGATPVRRGHLTARRSAARLAGWFGGSLGVLGRHRDQRG
jgi:hypothetical protein